MTVKRVYPDVHTPDLEPFFSVHMEAMTVESLHEKGDIAEQLALRDKRIASLETKLAFLIGGFSAANSLVRKHQPDLDEACDEADRIIVEARDLLSNGL